MTRSQFRLLALSTLLASSLTLPALAQEAAAPSAPAPEQVQGDHGPDHKMGKKWKNSAERFKQDDTNSDGFLTKDEMLAAHKKRIDEIYERLDANKDGKLSPEEMKKGRDDMRAKMKDKMKERHEKMGKGDGEAPEAPMTDKPE